MNEWCRAVGYTATKNKPRYEYLAGDMVGPFTIDDNWNKDDTDERYVSIKLGEKFDCIERGFLFAMIDHMGLTRQANKAVGSVVVPPGNYTDYANGFTIINSSTKTLNVLVGTSGKQTIYPPIK